MRQYLINAVMILFCLACAIPLGWLMAKAREILSKDAESDK